MEKRHPTSVEGFEGSLEGLAQRICRMRYDKLAEFFYYCSVEILRQANNDMLRKRTKLAILLTSLAGMLTIAQGKIEDIMSVCLPHMMAEIGEEESELIRKELVRKRRWWCKDT